LLGIEPLNNESHDNHGFIGIPYDADEGVSARREAILETLIDKTIVRPPPRLHCILEVVLTES
jgi:hypothetical protein